MKNNIYVIGYGAVGKALAVSLKLNNKNVVILRGSIDDEITRTEKIQVLLQNKTELEAEIEVSTLANFPELDGIIVLTNKSYGNERLSRELKNKTNTSPIVILQNGLGIERAFVDNNFPEIYRCVLFVTSQNISKNKVSYKPVSVSPIGTIKGNRSNLNTVVEQLDSPNFRFKSEFDIRPIIWKKAILNSAFNSICPLLEIDNGIFHRNEEVLRIAKRVTKECVAIARGNNIFLDVQEIMESLLLISKSSDGQLISTLQDIRNKRQTEIETLNFEIVNIAKTLNKEDLVKETKLLGELTKLKSALSK